MLDGILTHPKVVDNRGEKNGYPSLDIDQTFHANSNKLLFNSIALKPIDILAGFHRS